MRERVEGVPKKEKRSCVGRDWITTSRGWRKEKKKEEGGGDANTIKAEK